MRPLIICVFIVVPAVAVAQTPIAIGDRVTARLEAGDERLTTGELCDVYEFHAEAGQMLSLRHESDDFDCYLIYIDPMGYQQDNDDFGGALHSQIDITANATGTCRAVATTYSPGATGEYTFSVRAGAAPIGQEPN